MSASRDLAKAILKRAGEAGVRGAERQANETGTVTDDDPLTVDISGVEFDEDELLWPNTIDRGELDPGDTLAIQRVHDEYVVLAVLGDYESAPVAVARSAAAPPSLAALEARVAALEKALAELGGTG